VDVDHTIGHRGGRELNTCHELPQQRSGDDYLYALNPGIGALVWESETALQSGVCSSLDDTGATQWEVVVTETKAGS